MVEDTCRDIDEISEEYEMFKEKYNLPEWNSLEESFDISKAFLGDGGIILRDMRRKMNEKLASYIHLFETFMNPQATPIFITNALKNLEETDWSEIRRIYKKFAKIQFNQILADTIYSEEKEVETIKEIYSIWETEKNNLVKIIEKLDKQYSENSNNNKGNYFG